MADIKLIIHGEPQAQKRHRYTAKDGAGRPLKFVHTYDPSAEGKRNLREVVQRQAPGKLLLGPLRVDCYFYYGRPKSHYRTGRNAGILKDSAPLWKANGKDRDNCDKFVLDALTGVFFRDDSQICDGRIIKQYSEIPRTEIYITILSDKTTASYIRKSRNLRIERRCQDE
jgi:Holliday junction resolvase RusA-like endonuclease